MTKGNLFQRISIGIAILYGFSSCHSPYQEVEKAAQNELNRYKEMYVIALQTGFVKLPKGGKNPHITHPASGGLDTPMNNVWLINGGYMGEVYECRGCDSCMTCYQEAGLINYTIKSTEQDSVIAHVQLTEKGSQYLIDNYLDQPYSILNAWRRRMHLEMILVAKEKFDINMQTTDTEHIYRCKAARSLELTPFMEAIGGTTHDKIKDYYYTFQLDYKNPNNPKLSHKEKIPQ